MVVGVALGLEMGWVMAPVCLYFQMWMVIRVREMVVVRYLPLLQWEAMAKYLCFEVEALEWAWVRAFVLVVVGELWAEAFVFVLVIQVGSHSR